MRTSRTTRTVGLLWGRTNVDLGRKLSFLAVRSLLMATVAAAAMGTGNASAAPLEPAARPVEPSRPALAPTTTTVSSSVNPSVFGQSVTFTATVAPPPAGGTVSFTIDGGPACASVPVVAGTATCSTSSLSVGVHTVTASYSGFGASDPSASGVFLQTVLKADTATTLTSVPNPSTCGQSVTLTATVASVAPGAGTPTGTVTFKDGGAPIGTVALVAGSASMATSTLSVGTHSLTAEYNGSASHNTSTSAPTNHVVNKAISTTTVASSINPSLYGQLITFTATVTGCGTPTGVVVFNDNGIAIGTDTLNGAGQASITTAALDAGSHLITAVYVGDANNGPSDSGVLTQVVNKTSTTVTLVSNINPSVHGEIVTFTASLTAVGPGAGTPTGFVIFRDNGNPIGVGFVNGTGVALFATGALTVGSHPISAAYGGDANFVGVTSSTVSQTVNKANTTTTVETIASPNAACGGGGNQASCFGQVIIISSEVTVDSPGLGIPTGSVTFKDGAATLASVPLDSGGVAQFATGALAVGSHSITAEYNGSASQNTSTSSTWTHIVHKANTTTALDPAPSPNPKYGEVFQMHAHVTVNTPGAGIPSGDVEFKFVGPVTITRLASVGGGGEATFVYLPMEQTNPPTNPPPEPVLVPGIYTVTARYLGDDSFNASPVSNSRSLTIDKSATDINLTTSANPSVFGQLVTFTAIMSPRSPGSGTPTGTVTFKANAVNITCVAANPAPLDAQSKAQCAVSTLAVGTHVITAEYSGDSEFLAETATLTPDQVVNKVPTQTTLTSSVNPSVFGQSVTFDAHVAIVPPGSGIPTGSVEFKDGATSLGIVPLNVTGDASFTTTTLSVGSHSISANYLGTANIDVSSATLNQSVLKASTTTTLSPPDGTSFTVGSPAVFTANIAVVAPGGGTIAGTVKFQRAGVDIAGCAAVPVVAAAASCSTSTLPVGTHPIKAIYSGSPDHNTSQSPVQFYEVLGAASTTVVTGVPNPSVYGQVVTFSATVSGGVGTPTGTVIFKDGGINFGSAPLNGAGVATFATAGLSVGVHSITALYVGDATYSQSVSAPFLQTVNPAATTTVVTSVVNNPSRFGEAVTFRADVAAVVPGAGTPTGMVTFKDGATTIGTGMLNAAGRASFTTALLSVGAHTIFAEYAGDGNFSASTGSMSQSVIAADTTTTLTGTPNPSFLGDPVTFLAKVAAVAPGGGIPTGTVLFEADGGTIAGCGAVPLNALGEASCTTSTLTLGSHLIEATYSGSISHNASTDSMTQVVSNTPVDLSVISRGRPNPVRAGDDFTIAVTVTNHSTTDGVTVTLDDTLPAEIEFVSLVAPAGWTCTAPAVGSSGVVSCTGFLPAASIAVLEMIVHAPDTLPAGYLLENTAVVAGSQPDPNLADNTSIDHTTVYRTRRP